MSRRPLAAMLVAIIGLGFGAPARAFDLATLLGNTLVPGNYTVIHVKDLVAMMADKRSAVVVYDANVPEVRAKEGVIPGARLLPSYGTYGIAELPPSRDTRLVFYCHNRL